MRRLITALALAALAASPAFASDTTVLFAYNDGDVGVIAIEYAPPDQHQIRAECKYGRVSGPNSTAGTYSVSGKTVTGPHMGVVASSIRCVLKDAAGNVVFDQSRVQPGHVAALEAQVTSDRLVRWVCAQGGGGWGDGHSRTSDLLCEPVR